MWDKRETEILQLVAFALKLRVFSRMLNKNMDKDLQSLQEVREAVKRAKAAQAQFGRFRQEQIDRICAAMAEAGYRAAESLARLAVEDTGMGRVEDKVIKNQFATRTLWQAIRDEKTVGIIARDRLKRLIKVGEPMGVVAAIVPTTNPTSTVMYKAIIALKAGNAVIISPHPNAVKCSVAAAEVMRQAAEKAGAPQGLIQCLTMPTLEGAQALMSNPDVNVIVATGGKGIVKAAYSSGTPAYGVGPGDVPAMIERSADVPKAVRDILAGKTFDNGVICSSEQALIYEAVLDNAVKRELARHPVHIVNDAEKEKLRRYMFRENGKLNVAVVGKDPWKIAEAAGFTVKKTIRALIVPIQKVDKSEPFAREKLSPVLALVKAANVQQMFQMGLTMIEIGGMGHTAALHTRNDEIVDEFARTFPVGRLVVNSPAVHGSVGFTTELVPALTLGSGTRSGSITMDNITATHLINIKRLAYETKPLDRTGPRDSAIDRPFQSRKGTLGRKIPLEPLPQPGRREPEEIELPNPEKIRYGSSGLTEEEVERIIREFTT